MINTQVVCGPGKCEERGAPYVAVEVAVEIVTDNDRPQLPRDRKLQRLARADHTSHALRISVEGSLIPTRLEAAQQERDARRAAEETRLAAERRVRELERRR